MQPAAADRPTVNNSSVVVVEDVLGELCKLSCDHPEKDELSKWRCNYPDPSEAILALKRLTQPELLRRVGIVTPPHLRCIKLFSLWSAVASCLN